MNVFRWSWGRWIAVIIFMGLGFQAGGYWLGIPALIAALVAFAALDQAKRHTIEHLPKPPSRTIPQDVKIAVTIRDGGKCRACGTQRDLQFDHIFPYSKGGRSDDVANIQLLCRECNRLKSDRVLAS